MLASGVVRLPTLLTALVGTAAVAQIFPSGPMAPPQVPVAFGAAGKQASPVLLSLPTGAMVLWLDTARHPSLAEIRTVTTDGALMPTAFGRLPQVDVTVESFVATCGLINCFVASLCPDSLGGQVIRGQWLSLTGALVGPLLTLAPGTSAQRGHLAVAIGPQEEAAVVWVEAGDLMHTLLKPSGTTRVPTVLPTTGGQAYRRPAIVAVRENLYLAFDQSVSGSAHDLFFQVLHPDGGVRGAPQFVLRNPLGTFATELAAEDDEVMMTALELTMSGFGRARAIPVIGGMPLTGLAAFPSSSTAFGRAMAARLGGQWVVVVADEEGGVRGLRVATYQRDGGPFVDEGRVTGEPAVNYDDLARLGFTVGPGGDLLFAATAGATITEPDVVVGRLEFGPLRLSPTGGRRLVRTTAPQRSSAVSLNPQGGLVGWSEQQSPSMSRVIVRPINRFGDFTGPAQPVSAADPSVHSIEAVRLGTTPSGFAASWIAASHSLSLNFIQLGPTGLPLGPPIDAFPSMFARPTAVSFIETPGWTRAVFSVAHAGGGIWSTIALADGGWAPPFQHSSGFTPSHVVATTSGQFAFVAWHDGTTLAGTRATFDGGVLNDDAAGPIATGSLKELAVASDGVDFVAVWISTSAGISRVFAQRILGATGRPSGSALLLYSGPERSFLAGAGPRATFDGTNYQLVLSQLQGDAGIWLVTIRLDRAVGSSMSASARVGEHQFDPAIASDGRGRTLVSWTQSTPEPSTQVWASLGLQLLDGEVCSSGSHCRGRTCLTGRCCTPDAGTCESDAGATDAGPPDAGGLDASVMDAGGDAGALDAGASDSGSTAPDAGADDAGVMDAGVIDAGSDADAGGAGESLRRQYLVGCGCSGGADGAGWFMLALLALWSRRKSL